MLLSAAVFSNLYGGNQSILRLQTTVYQHLLSSEKDEWFSKHSDVTFVQISTDGINLIFQNQKHIPLMHFSEQITFNPFGTAPG